MSDQATQLRKLVEDTHEQIEAAERCNDSQTTTNTNTTTTTTTLSVAAPQTPSQLKSTAAPASDSVPSPDARDDASLSEVKPVHKASDDDHESAPQDTDEPPALEQRQPPASLRSPERKIARAIAITSGKGGVGKSNVAVNLACSFAAKGQRVCLIDADLGLANADVLCNVSPKKTLDDVVHGRCKLGEAILPVPGGFHLLAGASGVTRMADLTADEQSDLLRRLTALEKVVDIIIIDTGAGIQRNVLNFNAAAHDIIVTVTPEPTSITDGYGLIKALGKRHSDARIHLLVNMARSESEARAVFRRIDRVSRTFLEAPLMYAGWVPDDSIVKDAVRARTPFSIGAQKSGAAKRVNKLANYFSELPEFAQHGRAGAGKSLRASVDGSSNGFFSRLTKLVKKR